MPTSLASARAFLLTASLLSPGLAHAQPPPEAPPASAPSASLSAVPLASSAPPARPGASTPLAPSTSAPALTVAPLPVVSTPGTAPSPMGALSPPEASLAPPRSRVETRWYGWQTLVADGGALGLVLLGGLGGSQSLRFADSFYTLGVAGYVLASPIVHGSHGHVGKGFASLGMRVGLPLLGVALVASGSRHGSDNEALVGLGLATIIASVPASIALDAAVLAREEVKVPTVAWVPLVQPMRGGGTLGIGGTF